MSEERKFWGDCRDDDNFGKPFTDGELARVRALQAARMRFATTPLPVHSATGADGRWLATVDALQARLATLTREREEAVSLAARRLEHLNEQTRLAVEAWKESDVALAAMRASRDEAAKERDEARALLKEAIVWERDLEDDCVAYWRGLAAHAEHLSTYDPQDPESCSAWYCAVRRPDPECRSHNGSGNPCTCVDLINTAEDDVLPKTGPAARKMCETYMRLAALDAHLRHGDEREGVSNA